MNTTGFSKREVFDSAWLHQTVNNTTLSNWSGGVQGGVRPFSAYNVIRD